MIVITKLSIRLTHGILTMTKMFKTEETKYNKNAFEENGNVLRCA